jgi:hypothetical protein
MKAVIKPVLLLMLLAGLLIALHVRGHLRVVMESDAVVHIRQKLPFWSLPKPDQLGYADDRRAAGAPGAALSMEAKLVHSILLGRPYGLASEDLYFKNLPKNLSGTGFSLASAARQALGVSDEGLFNSRTLLTDYLAGAREPHALPDLPADVPTGLRSDDLAMLHVYALVMSGQVKAAEDVLAQSVESKSAYTRAFSIMALRAIGTPRAREIIKARSESGPDIMLARDALAFSVPNFAEPARFAYEVKPLRRFREPMLDQAKVESTTAILPTFLLAFVGADADAKQIESELRFLRGLHTTADTALWRKYMYGYTALAFRSQEPFEQWLTMYRADTDAQRRSFILRAMSAQHPDRFHSEMLPAFEKEIDGWTQFEFLAIYHGLIEGKVLYGHYDAIWMPPVRYRKAYPVVSEGIKRSRQAFVDLWASGRFPQDLYCSHCRQSWLADLIDITDEPKFVKGFFALKKRDAYTYGALRDLRDPRLAPVVKYLADSQTDARAREAAQKVHAELVERQSSGARQCCDANEACLRSAASKEADQDARFADDEAAMRYLDGLASGDDLKIEFLDAAKRRASVTRAGSSGRKDIYQHWLGCWRKDAG